MKEGAGGASSAAKGGAGGAGTKGARQEQDIRRSNGGPEAVQGDAWPCQRVYSRGQIPRQILRPNKVRAQKSRQGQREATDRRAHSDWL